MKNCQCSICLTKEPTPVEGDDGLIYWFKFAVDVNGEPEPVETFVDENGDVNPMFLGLNEKNVELEDNEEVFCPDCFLKRLDELSEEEDNA
jgi:hypothetical protein